MLVLILSVKKQPGVAAEQLHRLIFETNDPVENISEGEPSEGEFSEDGAVVTVESSGAGAKPENFTWWKSSYFDTITRDASRRCPTSASVSVWNGRLGNHIHQILHLLLFAHYCHVSHLGFPEHQGNMRGYSHQIGLLDMPTKLEFPREDQRQNHPKSCPYHAAHRHPWFGNF